jgi:hypothetical protein
VEGHLVGEEERREERPKLRAKDIYVSEIFGRERESSIYF